MRIVNDGSKRLPTTGIEYLTHCWNFMSGCENKERSICPVPNCWAKSITKRFPKLYPHGFEPTLYPSALLLPLSLKKPARIGVCFMSDLFGDWVDPDWIFSTINQCHQHQFFFLTKCPWNYQKWGKFPDNAWLGATICNQKMLKDTFMAFRNLPGYKWLSIEPLTESLNELHYLPLLIETIGISWVVIGGWSGGKGKQPEIAWIREIIIACDKAGIPVWLKYSLVGRIPIEEPFYKNDGSGWGIRQELPQVKG